MSTKYWAGIMAAMLAIFVIGMFAVRGVKKGASFVSSNLPVTLGMINDGFRVDGDRLGDIERVQFLRSTPGAVDSAVVTVQLNDSASIDTLKNCALRITHAAPFGRHTRFECVSSADSSQLGLQSFGHLVLLPGGQMVSLFIPAGDRANLLQNAYRGTGSGESGNVDIEAAHGRLSLTIGGREIVNINGDSAGGSIEIRDAHGVPILRLHGSDDHDTAGAQDPDSL